MKKGLLLFGILGLLLSSYTYLIHALPNDKSILFSGSGNCTLCHSGSSGVLTNAAGRDVSPVYHWQSSMMGNAAKDPYWQAKVSSEVEENPHLKEIIEDKCATCHAPMGRTEAIYNGRTYYTFNEVKTDPLSQDGVSCTVCHQIDPDNLSSPESFSGKYLIKPLKHIYGPYENPFTTSMVNNTGYLPVHGPHVASSALCATCHTLATPYVDENGDIAGYFPEQMPYYEWLNSSYPNQELSCQKCHMPQVNESMKIASMPANLQNKRNPIFEHHFVGGNTIINKLLSNNKTALGVNSENANLDTTAHYTLKNLKENSITLSAIATRKDSLVSVSFTLKNKTGHKIPTGFPSRRMWLHFTAKDNEGHTIFESGKYDQNGVITSQTGFENHHDTISNENNVQIYEAVLGNTLNQVTTILIEASQYLKDNRIPPVGFKTNQPYDSLIAITGKATEDGSFNKSNNDTQGTGSDQITYTFPFTGNSLNYSIEVCYQSIKPNYTSHLTESGTDESKRFTQMYSDNTDPKLEIISRLEAELSLTNLISNTKTTNNKIYPNPSKGEVHLMGSYNWPLNYAIYSLSGKLIANGKLNSPIISLHSIKKGAYILQIKSNNINKTFDLIYN